MSISVTRTTVVRAHQALDEIGCSQLHRILDDLIDHHGTTDLILDLSQAGPIDGALKDILEQTQSRIGELGGALEVRTPPDPSHELLEIVEDVPTFAPIEIDP